MKRRLLRGVAATLALAAATATLAQGLTLSGRMGERALLVIDGRPHTLAVGQTAAGGRPLDVHGRAT